MIRIAILALLILAGCERLDNVGKAPTFSPPGAPLEPPPPPAPRRVALATPPPEPQPAGSAAASLWRSGPQSLFGDRRAKRPGDIVTVVIEIDDEASINNATQRSRSGSENMSVSALFGLPAVVEGALNANTDPGAALNSDSSSTGAGSVARNEQITLRVAASVVDVLPNGHMVIAGAQEVRVNYELRDLQVSGIIRPEDVSRRNEITYDRIAEARIAYGGRGQIMDVQQPRYGQQIADIILPF
ncbi:flagellar basal body L-ring protein FlgH [Rhodovulum sp. DZ06]|uniref:flagellar basal body L-ring protein FlgH n=1 Tax=Rhodovulum sp. DZ06 TaxID=3425126 RepID=UPI003D352935